MMASDATEIPKRSEYKLSVAGAAGFALSGLVIIALQVLEHGYSQKWWYPVDLLGAPAAALPPLVKIVLICIDGAAKAAFIGFAVTVIFRLDIRKVFDRIIHDGEHWRAKFDEVSQELQAANSKLAGMAGPSGAPSVTMVDETTREWLAKLQNNELAIQLAALTTQLERERETAAENATKLQKQADEAKEKRDAALADLSKALQVFSRFEDFAKYTAEVRSTIENDKNPSA